MQTKKAWITCLIRAFFCLILALSVANCGTTDEDSAADEGNNNNNGNPTLASDFSDYTFEEPVVPGNTFYIDPVNGSGSGDGSADNPWRTLQQVIEDGLIQYYQHAEAYNPDSELVAVNEDAPVRGGDCLLLRDGYHGHVALNAFIFDQWLTIAAQEGHTPVLSQFKLNGAFKKIYLKNLTLRKDSYDGPENYWEADEINHNSNACLYLASNSFWGRGSQVKAYGLTVGTTLDAAGWTAADWVEKSAAGISLRSVTHCEIVNCHIENINFGLNIEYASDHTRAVGNTIKYFSGDGCRLISNNVFLAYNTISDCLKVDDNHDDAIQSYSRGEDNSPGTGVLYNNVVRGNLIIGTTDFSHPLASNPQGIGCFDGFFDGWVVENNVVIVDHFHGISFYGMRNSYILNNTVIDQDYSNEISPWIMIHDHKDHTYSRDCVIANNIAFRSVSVPERDPETEPDTHITAHHNYVIGRDNAAQLYDLFVDPDNFDFHLQNDTLTQTSIIDQGEPFADMISSQIDRDDVARTGSPDLGAYEVD